MNNPYDDNSVDVFPFTPVVISEDEREAMFRLLATQPDGNELAIVLGLVAAPPVPKPVPNVGFRFERKDWCDIHNIARESFKWNPNATRCPTCFREKARERYYKTKGKPMPEKVREYNRKADDV